MSSYRTTHGNLDAHAAQSGDAISFNRSTSFELETELSEERDGRIDVLHHDADVVHAHDGHDVRKRRWRLSIRGLSARTRGRASSR